MQKLLSRSKHEESELNLVLQIRNQRKEKQKVEEKGMQLKFGRIAKFRKLQIFATRSLVLSLFTLRHCSGCPFDCLTFVPLFHFLSTFSL